MCSFPSLNPAVTFSLQKAYFNSIEANVIKIWAHKFWMTGKRHLVNDYNFLLRNYHNTNCGYRCFISRTQELEKSSLFIWFSLDSILSFLPFLQQKSNLF